MILSEEYLGDPSNSIGKPETHGPRSARARSREATLFCRVQRQYLCGVRSGYSERVDKPATVSVATRVREARVGRIAKLGRQKFNAASKAAAAAARVCLPAAAPRSYTAWSHTLPLRCTN